MTAGGSPASSPGSSSTSPPAQPERRKDLAVALQVEGASAVTPVAVQSRGGSDAFAFVACFGLYTTLIFHFTTGFGTRTSEVLLSAVVWYVGFLVSESIFLVSPAMRAFHTADRELNVRQRVDALREANTVRLEAHLRVFETPISGTHAGVRRCVWEGRSVIPTGHVCDATGSLGRLEEERSAHVEFQTRVEYADDRSARELTRRAEGFIAKHAPKGDSCEVKYVVVVPGLDADEQELLYREVYDKPLLSGPVGYFGSMLFLIAWPFRMLFCYRTPAYRVTIVKRISAGWQEPGSTNSLDEYESRLSYSTPSKPFNMPYPSVDCSA